MVRRVIIGTRNGVQGMWVTVPGRDALTSNAPEDFLVDNARINSQPVFKGIITNPELSYVSTTRYTSFENYNECVEYDGYWKSCVCFDGNYNPITYNNCEWVVYCKKYETKQKQIDHPGVATYSKTITHNLGYIPQCILSATTEYPGSPCPNIFIDAANIYLRYYEADVGYEAAGIVFTAAKPSTYTLNCTVHYTLYAQAA